MVRLQHVTGHYQVFFHHVARRLKRHRARWNKQGTDVLVRLMAARANGGNLPVIAQSDCIKHTKKVGVPTRVSVKEEEVGRKVEDAARWLSTHRQALVGPHADRPWVKYMLRELARLPHTIA
ncbi:hypothetical protein SAMN05421799_103232 [Alicyclobacillus vulcanalis]|uniref:Uncharacterized protein n=1 Tax=Alicyclobacillus vulcanalis TaxID=252246 RepID=A0A1N7LLI4_9BACL|nr:hypothetical protein [Alicyclobacillus vulcanalis]SIS74652.1 hypothetical protein SAMN05421799_103232 [Alicyclobacillus vulcanalis]